MKISLCITSYYKDVKLLNNLLNLFTSQTIAPYEIIVYCSGLDGMRLSPYLTIKNTSVPVFSVVSYKRTIQSVARNICASVATGDVIIFFDVDDYPHYQKIEITNEIFKKYDPDFMVHSYSKTDTNLYKTIEVEDIVPKNNLSNSAHDTNIICEDHSIHHAHIAVKKTIFEKIKYNEHINYYRKEDGKFCQDLLSHNFKGLFINYPLVIYT